MKIQIELTDEEVAKIMGAIDCHQALHGYDADLTSGWFVLMDALAMLTALAMPPNEELPLIYPEMVEALR